MSFNEKQGLQYIKTIEGFNSQYIMPETTNKNNEDLSHLENLKRKFQTAISNYGSLRKIIADNARNYVTLKDKDSVEYNNFINRNIQLGDGSKFHVTNSGLAKKYSEDSWNNRHATCKRIDEDLKTVNIQDEEQLKNGSPKILIGTPMKTNEPCGYGFQNVEVNLPVHGDPKLEGCFYNTSTSDEARNIIVSDEQALKPDPGDEIIGKDMTYEECRLKSLTKLKDFFSLTNLDSNNKGTCIGSNNSDPNLKYDRFGKAEDKDGKMLCDQTSGGYAIGKPQKCKKVPDVCQPREYEQIDDFYDCDVTDSIGATSEITGTVRGGSTVLYPHYYIRVSIQAGNGRWAGSRAAQKIVVAYDKLAQIWSPEIPFTGNITKGSTFVKEVKVPFEPDKTEIYGISIYFGRDYLDARSVSLEISRDMTEWQSVGSVDIGEINDGAHGTKYNQWFTIRNAKEYSIHNILPKDKVWPSSTDNIELGKPNEDSWSPYDTHWNGEYYITLPQKKLVTSLKVEGNVTSIQLFYIWAGSASKDYWVTYTGSESGSEAKTIDVETASNGVVYLDYPIMVNTLCVRVSSFKDNGDSFGRAKMNVTVYGTDVENVHSKVNFEGTYKAVGSKAVAVQTNLGEMTFENCIKKAAEDNVRYFGIFDYNKETNKVKCFFPTRANGDDSANDFYMAGYEDSWEKLADSDSVARENGVKSGTSREKMAIYTTDAKCFKRKKNGKPLECPSNTVYYGIVPGVGSTDQCCTQKDDCDAGFSTIYSTNIIDSSTMGAKGFVDRNNELHPYHNLKIEDSDKSCPKTDVTSITGELWSSFNMGDPMTKERTCGIAKLSPDELEQLNDAEKEMKDAADNIDKAISNSYNKNIQLKEKNRENKDIFDRTFENYKKQYKKVATNYSEKIQTIYEDLELKHSGDYAQMAFLILTFSAIVGGGIYYIRKTKKSQM